MDLLINQLYSATSEESRRQADVQLKAYQQSIQAWAIPDTAFSQQQATNIAYFYANTLRSKVNYDYHQLSLDQALRFKENLIAFIKQVGPGPVRTQLILALCGLTIQLVKVWENPVIDFTKYFNNDAEVILDILTYLPEELESEKLIVENSHKKLMREKLESVFPLVNGFLNSVNSQKVFKCYLSWLRFYAAPPEFLVGSPVFEAALAQMDLEIILEISVLAQADPSKYAEVLARVLGKLKSAGNPPDEEDDAVMYAKMHVAVLSCMLEPLSQFTGEYQLFYDRLLGFLGSEIDEVVAVTSDFVVDLCYEVPRSSQIPQASNFGEKVLSVLFKRLETAEEDSEVRLAISGCLNVVAHKLIGLENFVKVGISRICSTIDNIKTNEAATFACKSVFDRNEQFAAEFFSSFQGSADIVNGLVRVVSVSSIHAASDDDMRRRTGLVGLLGYFGDAGIETRLDLFSSILSLTADIKGKSAVQRIACKSLNETLNNAKSAKNFLNQLIEVMRKCPPKFGVMFIEGIVKLVHDIRDDPKYFQVLSVAIEPLVLRLQDRQSSTRCDDLDSLANFCRSVVVTDRQVDLFKSQIAPALFQSLELCLQICRGDENCTEQTCRTLKHFIRIKPSVCKVFLPRICNLILAEFNYHQWSSLLYIAEILVDAYGDAPELKILFEEMIKILTKNPGSLTELVIEDLFGMIGRFMRFAPSIVFGSTFLCPLLELGIKSLVEVNRRETFDTLFAVFTPLFLSHPKDGSISNLIRQVAPVLVSQIFKLFTKGCREDVQIYIPGLFDAIRCFDSEVCSSALREGLKFLPPGVVSEPDQAIKELMFETTATRRVQEIAKKCEQIQARS
jgi:hypothetical protein